MVRTTPSTDRHERELLAENAYVGELYDRLEAERELATDRLRAIHRQSEGGTLQSRLERDTLEIHHTRRLAELHAAEYGLCFGRIDRTDGARQYIGRIALADEDHEPLLTDWRAPAAEPFYRATPAAPGPVAARRHLRCKGRTVVDFDDDAFDLDHRSGAALSGEGALLASLTAARTGRMGDIVSTIQAEQDRVIRSELGGVLVVQGGPGTGKTVVALHRAAYLLYTHRDRLAKRGVLVIGPNTTFLRYIDQVLPSLGESEVVLSSIGTLYPGHTAAGADTPEAAAVKGGARMAGVLAAALAGLCRLPDDHWTVTLGRGSAHREEMAVSRALGERAQAAARRTNEPHLRARPALVERLTSELALRIARDRAEELDLDAVADLADELVEDPEVQRVAELLWPRLTPEQLLTALYTSPELLAEAAPELAPAERAALLRADNLAWTEADIPLLDEAAELLGTPSTRPRPKQPAFDAEELALAERVLSDFGEGLAEIDAQKLMQQYQGESALRPLAERAAEDWLWAYGHVIVDEAQDLSPMAWRMLARRCPGRSMTIVGDLAQTGTPGGLDSWGEALDAYTAGRWRSVELSVNYRTPAEIMQVAEATLHRLDPALTAPRAVRTGGTHPWSRRLPADNPLPALLAAVTEQLAARTEGRLAVIHPPTYPAELLAALAELPGMTTPDSPTALDSPALLLTPAQSKGLEFDTVLVLDPTAITTAHPRGHNDLYVALTRATKHLGVLHTEDLPPTLTTLTPR
ncbi:hypothetical protein CFP65_6201 [Kitasatospora sp. MMS16-BH015]|uniref:ATP-binding domain-containing protein n=1 Tax=Kitasatospora sp. MMS16-BH015 TaxID=2018025 RepID=UPI000CA14316|nr:ATP-binding domain-containing protein [Kitasatospora sp. MMS16-BH015]AUG80866.1 hypothetical protein CFP65_6201 [Kitasatospora sp. MMS16-BH015]